MKKSAITLTIYGLTALSIAAISFLATTNMLHSFPSPQENTGISSDLGKSIYEAKCAPCHGSDGKGNGMFAFNLNPKPRDFTKGMYKFRTTKSGSIPTDDNLTQSINRGLHGTSMPAWNEFLTGDSLRTIIAYVKSFSRRFQSEQPQPVTVSSPIPVSEKSIAAGKIAYQKLECASCHGSDGTGKDAVATDLTDEWGNHLLATNLTQPWLFRGGSSSADIYLRLKTGIDGTPMPSYEATANDQDLWNVANYLGSLARKPVWEMNKEELASFYAAEDEASKTNLIARGNYLVEGLGCADCHSSYKEGRVMMEEFRMAGGSRWTLGPYGDFFSPNLTSDKETGLGNWSDKEIKDALTKGIMKDGRRMLPFPMPWTSYAQLKQDDILAIIAYLRTIPPVYNKIPEPEPLNVFSYLAAKFRMLILKEDISLTLYPGNAGQTQSMGSALPAHKSITATTDTKEK